MKTAGQIIIEYEQARQEVSKWNTKRSNLLNACENFDTVNENTLCLTKAWEEMKKLNNDCGFGDGYSYWEVLSNLEDCCPNCIKSYDIKTTELAQAKQVLGKAKRALAARGKKLIKEQ